MSGEKRLRVAINAQIVPGVNGGVSTALKSLVRDLGRLTDGDEEYIIVVQSEEQSEWLKAVAGPNERFVTVPAPGRAVNGRKGTVPFRRMLKKGVTRVIAPFLPYARELINAPFQSNWPEVPLSDGFWEGTGCDVVHFTFQSFILCSLPTVYNPHDLQHLHYPQFWDRKTLAWRETIYPAGCRFAHTVVVGSQWVKDDVLRHYRVDPGKVQVIPEGSPTQSYPEPPWDFVMKVKEKYGLQPPFMLYPAVTWPHKNHLRLLEALAYLRVIRPDLPLRLVCPGARYPGFWPHVEERIRTLKLESQVRFPGFVPEEDLRAIYRLSQFLIQPSLFEASSLPIFEAWSEGVPVACSDATALPQQVGNGALLFDPTSVESIADAVIRFSTNEELREELRIRGRERLKDFDCERTAKAYRAVYRRAAGFPLTDEDRRLFGWNWMMEPERKKEN